MKVILSPPITDDLLIASSIAEDDHPVWSANVTYSRGDPVISIATHTVYRSLRDNNLANDPNIEQLKLADPLIDDPDPQYWQLISATDRFKPFDGKPAQVVTRPNLISMTILPGTFVGGISAFNLLADFVTVEMRSPSLPRRNLFIDTENLLSANWSKSRVGVLSTDMDGEFILAPTVDDGTHVLSQALTRPEGIDTISLEARAEGYDWIRLQFGGSSQNPQEFANFNVSNGTTGMNTGLSASIERLADGWFRCVLSAPWELTEGNVNPLIMALPENTSSAAFTGDGISGIRLRKPQIEAGPRVSDYQRVTDDSDFDKTVYSRTLRMQDDSGVRDLLQYFIAPIRRITEFAVTDLPPFLDGEVTISFKRSEGNVSVGQVHFGEVVTIGKALRDGAAFAGLDFSSVDTDIFGNNTTIQRDATRISDIPVMVNTSDLLFIEGIFKQLRGGKQAVWIGSSDPRKAAINIGFLRDFRVAYPSTRKSMIMLQIQGTV